MSYIEQQLLAQRETFLFENLLLLFAVGNIPMIYSKAVIIDWKDSLITRKNM